MRISFPIACQHGKVGLTSLSRPQARYFDEKGQSIGWVGLLRHAAALAAIRMEADGDTNLTSASDPEDKKGVHVGRRSCA